MHPALWTLMKLRWHAAGRQLLRQIRTVRGALVLLFWLGAMSTWLCMGFVAPLFQPAPVIDLAQELVRDFSSLGMFLMWLGLLAMSAGDKALVFSMAEVDFLFAAPFKRRELIAFKDSRRSFC
jgi:hypothetical protein